MQSYEVQPDTIFPGAYRVVAVGVQGFAAIFTGWEAEAHAVQYAVKKNKAELERHQTKLKTQGEM